MPVFPIPPILPIPVFPMPLMPPIPLMPVLPIPLIVEVPPKLLLLPAAPPIDCVVPAIVLVPCALASKPCRAIKLNTKANDKLNDLIFMIAAPTNPVWIERKEGGVKNFIHNIKHRKPVEASVHHYISFRKQEIANSSKQGGIECSNSPNTYFEFVCYISYPQ
jgi:hypothetical protein